MATKLKGLHVKKVDFVDEGANQRADIKLLKSKNGAEETTDPETGLFKRFMNWLNKEVQKSATTFDEQINAVSMDAIRDEIWSVCYALQNSLNSILCDPELDSSGKQTAMNTSIEQFGTAMKEYITGWASGTSAKIKKNLDAPDETDLPMVMKARNNLEEIIQKSVDMKGELEDMLKIDKSRMSAEEKTAYDELIKKYAVETNEDPLEKKAPPKTEPVENPDIIDDGGAEKKTDTKKSLTPPGGNLEDDIYKGMNPVVKARLEALEKRAEEAEDRELLGIAKKYEVLGEKPEELFKTLKTLKNAGGTAFNDMIGVLDRNMALINNSGVFGEIGKSFSGGAATAVKKSAAEGKIDTIAKGLIEKDPSLSYNMALAKAWENHPELMAEYEDEAGY